MNLRTFAANFFRTERPESMARLVEFLGVLLCLVILWRWVEKTGGDPTLGVVSIVGIVVTGKTAQRWTELKSRAMDEGAPKTPQP